MFTFRKPIILSRGTDMLEKIVTKKSNCLIEALKAKIKDPRNVRIGYLAPSINHGELHFWWIKDSEGKAYHFRSDKDEKFHFFFLGSICRNDLVFFQDFVIKRCFYSKKSVKATLKYCRKAGLIVTEKAIEDGFYQRSNYDSNYAKWYRSKYPEADQVKA